MIFTRHFGALAARPNFHELAEKQKQESREFDRQLDDLLKADREAESAER